MQFLLEHWKVIVFIELVCFCFLLSGKRRVTQQRILLGCIFIFTVVTIGIVIRNFYLILLQ